MKFASMVVGLGVVLFSNESPAQWIMQNVPPDVSLLLSVNFSSTDFGSACGYIVYPDTTLRFEGRAISTTNGGATWSLAQVPDSSRSLVSVQMLGNGEGFIAGAYNSSLPMSGKHSGRRPPTGYSRAALARADYFERIGMDGGGSYGGMLLKTTNNGQSWNTWGALPESTYYLLGLSFTDAGNGWVTTSTTPEVRQAEILRTTNGGMTWTVCGISDSIGSLPSIRFFSPSLGYAVGYQVNNQIVSGVILRTTDGGVVWEQYDFPEVNNFTGVSVVDDSSAYASGINQIAAPVVYKTTNGGKDWGEIPFKGTSAIFQGVCFATGTPTGLVYGATSSLGLCAARTTDGGSSWTEADLPMAESSILTGAFLLDEKNGYLVGGNPFAHAFVFHTTNGGSTFVSENEGILPRGFALLQNYPNPFNPSTTIRFSVPKSGEVGLKVFNLLGEEVATLISGNRDAGPHTVQWDATGHPSGVYFYRLQAGEFLETRKLVLVR